MLTAAGAFEALACLTTFATTRSPLPSISTIPTSISAWSPTKPGRITFAWPCPTHSGSAAATPAWSCGPSECNNHDQTNGIRLNPGFANEASIDRTREYGVRSCRHGPGAGRSFTPSLLPLKVVGTQLRNSAGDPVRAARGEHGQPRMDERRRGPHPDDGADRHS